MINLNLKEYKLLMVEFGCKHIDVYCKIISIWCMFTFFHKMLEKCISIKMNICIFDSHEVQNRKK